MLTQPLFKKITKRIILTILIVFGLSSSQLFAKNVCNYGLECPIEKNDIKTKTTYFVYNKYIVSTHGEDVLNGTPLSLKVFKRKKVRQSRDHDITNIESIIDGDKTIILDIKPSPSSWFDGIKGNYLVMNGGTSNNSKELKIFSLENKNVIFSSDLSDYVIMGNVLLYYEFYREIQNKNDNYYKRCFKELGIDFGLVLEQLNTFNLKEGRNLKLNDYRCAYNE